MPCVTPSGWAGIGWPPDLVMADHARVGFLDANGLAFRLPDGRVLFRDVSFKVGTNSVVALVGANGVGKTTLLRILSNELVPTAGSVRVQGGLGVMPQFVGS